MHSLEKLEKTRGASLYNTETEFWSTSTNYAEKLNRSDGSGSERRMMERSPEDAEFQLSTGVVIDPLHEAKTIMRSGPFDFIMVEIRNDQMFSISKYM